MLVRTLGVIAALFLATGAHAASDDLQTLVKSAMAGSKVPAVGAVLMRDGTVSALAVQGVRRIDGNATVKPDDVWLIGSTGKVMTVAMVARLVERGLLSWDTPLEALLPDLAVHMNPPYRKVTLLQLLSHRSGLPRDIANLAASEKYFTDTRAASAQREKFVINALRDKPIAATGSTFAYSNSAFLVAAMIAERATGQSYEALMQREVFAPLGMQTVGFGNTGEGQNRGHQHGKPMTQMVKFDDGAPAMYAPAGFLHMSLGDWARFNLDQLAGATGRGKLLKSASSANGDRPAG